MSSPSPTAPPDLAALARQTQATLTREKKRAEQLVQEIHELARRARTDPKARAALLALEQHANGDWGEQQKQLHQHLLKLEQMLDAHPAPSPADAPRADRPSPPCASQATRRRSRL